METTTKKKVYPRATRADILCTYLLREEVPAEEVPAVLEVIDRFLCKIEGQKIRAWLNKELSETGGVPEEIAQGHQFATSLKREVEIASGIPAGYLG